MQTIESTPRTSDASPPPGAPSIASSDRRHRGDQALLVALLGPPSAIYLLTVLGVRFGVAVGVVFTTVFAITTAMDISGMSRRRRGKIRSQAE